MQDSIFIETTIKETPGKLDLRRQQGNHAAMQRDDSRKKKTAINVSMAGKVKRRDVTGEVYCERRELDMNG